jgi:hypothetical protein
MSSEQAQWRKSRYSGTQSGCVEVRAELNALRDSKNPGPVLTCDIRALVADVKSDRF